LHQPKPNSLLAPVTEIHFPQPATGSDNPAEVAIFQLPMYKPLMILTGHRDWSFCTEFLTEDRVISGSRDCSVSMWSATDLEGSWTRDPIITKTEHQGKVRSLAVNSNAGYFCTLGVEGTIKTWDSTTFSVVNSLDITENQELVCLALNKEKDIVAAGSQCHVSMFCLKSGKALYTIPSHDGDWGVRSLSFQDFLVTIGGGAGRMAFYDTRKNAFLKIEGMDDEEEFFLQTGNGWLEKDEMYYRHFNATTIPNAIYTHSYDPSGTRLFVGGGPLMLGLKGSYAGIW